MIGISVEAWSVLASKADLMIPEALTLLIGALAAADGAPPPASSSCMLPLSDCQAGDVYPSWWVRARNQKDRCAKGCVVHLAWRPVDTASDVDRPIRSRSNNHQFGCLVGVDRLGIGKRYIERCSCGPIGKAARAIDDRAAGIWDEANC